jgi:protein-disulfide isomerase
MQIMNNLTCLTRTLRRPWMAAAVLGCLIPLTAIAADQPAEPAGSAAISGDTAAAILKELKEIRRVLEKIEKQGQGQKRPAKPTTATVSVKNKPSMGDSGAPVTVVEFADYQCPFCLRFTKNTFPHLKRDFIDTGKVRWVALNLPLAFHKDARKAAQAAHCAGEQDKFWEMREVLFRNPQKLGREHLPEHAGTVQLDIEAFKECIDSERHLDEIDQDAKDAGAVRLTGTPSFIVGKTASDKITGQVIVGAQPLSAFNAAINKALGSTPAAAKPAAKAAGDKPAGK